MVFQDLSRHAEDVFGELTNEAHQFNDRCRILGERIVNLNDRISLMAQNSSEHMEPYALRSREIKYDDQVIRTHRQITFTRRYENGIKIPNILFRWFLVIHFQKLYRRRIMKPIRPLRYKCFR